MFGVSADEIFSEIRLTYKFIEHTNYYYVKYHKIYIKGGPLWTVSVIGTEIQKTSKNLKMQETWRDINTSSWWINLPASFKERMTTIIYNKAVDRGSPLVQLLQLDGDIQELSYKIKNTLRYILSEDGQGTQIT